MTNTHWCYYIIYFYKTHYSRLKTLFVQVSHKCLHRPPLLGRFISPLFLGQLSIYSGVSKQHQLNSSREFVLDIK